MSIYIKGMEMPTSCGDCKAFVCYKQWAGDMGDCFCGITKEDAKAKEKNADCPLVPVPLHGRLIDADAFLALINDSTILSDFLKCIINPLIRGEPTVIEAEEGEG